MCELSSLTFRWPVKKRVQKRDKRHIFKTNIVLIEFVKHLLYIGQWFFYQELINFFKKVSKLK